MRCVRSISINLYSENASAIRSISFRNRRSRSLLAILPVETSSNLKGRPLAKNEATKSSSLVTTTRASRIEIALISLSGVLFCRSRSSVWIASCPASLKRYTSLRGRCASIKNFILLSPVRALPDSISRQKQGPPRYLLCSNLHNRPKCHLSTSPRSTVPKSSRPDTATPGCTVCHDKFQGLW